MPPRLRRWLRALREAPPQLVWAGVVAVLALGSLLIPQAAGRLGRPPEPAPAEPETAPDPAASLRARAAQTVQDALEAARTGDLAAYLERFGEPLRSQLDRTRRERGDAYLRDYLRRTMEPVKGLAIDHTRIELDPDEAGADLARVPVEFVYQDRNEVQRFLLRRDGDAWRIARVEAVRAVRTLIPYGTPIEDVR